MRLFELAKQYHVEQDRLLKAVNAAGFPVVNTLSTVPPEAIAWIEKEAAQGFPSLPTAESLAEKKPHRPPFPKKKKATKEEETPPSPETVEATPTVSIESPPPAPTPVEEPPPEKKKTVKQKVKIKRERKKVEPAAIAEEKIETPPPPPPEPEPLKKEEPSPSSVVSSLASLAKTLREGEAPPSPERPISSPTPPPTEGEAVIELIESKAEEVPAPRHKHKRADFRPSRRRPVELPPMFAALDTEPTRSIRTRPSRRQRTLSRTATTTRRTGRTTAGTPRERDPNQIVQLSPAMSVRDLSAALGIKLADILGFLMENGQMAQANDILPQDLIELVAEAFEIRYEWKISQSIEEELRKLTELETTPTESKIRLPRPPVVTFMGHVDHGKTSLLDKIRQTRIAETEAGGITQHIGAYSIVKNGHPITFLDTPGHEAFTEMRARGANLTDIAVLVVAADDGVMPQTEEAYHHAKTAGVPVVVAINKCDLPSANPDRVRHELAQKLGLLPEEWGGKVGMIPVSALTGKGIDDLLERILLEAEMLELTYDPTRKAVGFIVEAKMTENRGVVATVFIRDGTLHRGDIILCSTGYGKVKLMYDCWGKTCETATAGQAVSITGLSAVPEAGERLYVLDDLAKARAIAEERERQMRAATLAKRRHITLETLQSHLASEAVRELRVIVKADVKGSLEVIEKTLQELATDEVKIRILHSGVGGINHADVILADASDAIVIGFHVMPDQAARLYAAGHNVQIKVYHVIYRLIEEMKAAIAGLLPPEEKEVVQGHLEIRQVFRTSRYGNIAGCYVVDGMITRHSRVRLIRDNVVIYDGVLENLKRFKDDVREVRAGFECGLKIANYDDIKEGDQIEAYTIEEVARTLDSV